MEVVLQAQWRPGWHSAVTQVVCADVLCVECFFGLLQPRSYLAGSDRDVQVSPGANIAIVTAGSLAIAGIASGLIINFNNKEPRGEFAA